MAIIYILAAVLLANENITPKILVGVCFSAVLDLFACSRVAFFAPGNDVWCVGMKTEKSSVAAAGTGRMCRMGIANKLFPLFFHRVRLAQFY